MKAHPHDVRILEHQVVELTRVLSDVEEAHLDKAGEAESEDIS